MSMYAKGPKGRADRLFSLLVRARGACERCHGTNSLQCAHIVSRRFSATRCEPSNAWCLCAGCHLELTHDPHKHVQFAIETRGSGGYKALREKAYAGAKVDWAEVASELAVQVKALERAS